MKGTLEIWQTRQERGRPGGRPRQIWRDSIEKIIEINRHMME
jgi:hypothetical protein